jgi:hypothetical protein
MPQIRRIFERTDEKKEQKKRRTAGIVIALIMLFSIAAFAFMESTSTTDENTQKYKDYVFQRGDAGWETKANNLQIVTQFLPQEVENISSAQFISGELGNTIFFIADSYDERQAAAELSGVLSSQRKQFACLPEDENKSECADLPLKSCDDASSESGIVIITESNETSVSYNSFCITINGNATELVKAADKAIFKITGII